MPTQIIVPLLGEGVEEVTIVKWLKTEGDSIQLHEGLVEVETDKVVTEIPSPATGTLIKIAIPDEGVNVAVGTVLAWIGEPGETIDGPGPKPAFEILSTKKSLAHPETPVPELEVLEPLISDNQVGSIQGSAPILPGRDQALGFISPVVAKIASNANIDLSKVRGTGLGGRITKRDILEFFDSGLKPQRSEAPEPVAPVTIQPTKAEPGGFIPHSIMRKRIAEHMIMSKRTSPHVTTLMEADMSKVVAHRQANKEEFARHGARLTVTAYFVSAAVAALKTHPVVNASWGDEGIRLLKDINIGIATDLGEEGLIVPVIKGADDLSLMGIARAVNDLADRARSKRLKPDDVQGATFSITNHGITGSLLATPIINQPQIAILGVGAIQKRVVVVSDEFGNDTIAIRPMIYLTLTFDHRVLDGAAADHFLAKVVETLRDW